MPVAVHPTRFLTTAALMALVAAPCSAQEQAADTAHAVAIDTLSVRVLRTPVPARRAPYAVSAKSGEELRRARPGMALDETLGGIPGVQVDNRFNYALGERISVRGFGARAQFGVRGVRVLVDGLPATLPDGQTTLNHVDVGDLGRAEVVRGPASALYGNAAGGVVRLSTLPPPLVPLASEYRVTGGSDGLLRLQTSAGGTSDVLAYRATLSRLDYGGYRDHADAGTTLGSASLAWRRAGDALRLSFTGVRYDARSAGSLTDSLLRADRRAVAPVYLRDDTGEEGRQGQLGMTWEHALGEGALEATAYVLGRSVENPIPFSFVDLDRRVGGVRAAVSGALALGGRSARWTAGAEAERQRDDRRNFTNESGRPGTVTLDQLERVTALAGFAQALVPLAPRLDLLGALRYDRFRFEADDRLVTANNPDDSGARTMDAWSPTAGVTFAASGVVSLYANFATAFETPTTTELVNRPTGAGGFNPDLQPQRTTSFEVGMKGRAGPASFDLAAYHARVRDALIPFEVEGAPGRQFFRNAGRAVHRGVEASAALDLGDVRAHVAYTFTDARFGTYVRSGVDLEGNRVPGIAPHRMDASVDWSSRRGPFAGADARFESDVPVADTDSTGAFASPAYAVFDLRAGWAEARLGRFRATPSVGVRNLFGAEYNTSVSVNAAGRRYYEPGPGRTFHLGLALRLGGDR